MDLDGCRDDGSALADGEGDFVSLHRNMFLQRLANTFNDKSMSDVTFLVDGEEVYASRVVLVAASDYFRAMLCTQAFREHSVDEPIELSGVSKSALIFCLRYLYCAPLDLDSANVEETFLAADMFSIGTLCRLCCKTMIDLLDSSNCFKYLALADQLPTLSSHLRLACLEYIEESTVGLLNDSALAKDLVRSLSFGTMLEVCRRTGRGIAKQAGTFPVMPLKHAMEVLSSWGVAKWGRDAATPQGLCRKVFEISAQQLLSDNERVHKQDVCFRLTSEHFDSKESSVEMVTRLFDVDDFKFEVSLVIDNSGTGKVTVYVRPVRHSFPEWWQCHYASRCFPSTTEVDAAVASGRCDVFHTFGGAGMHPAWQLNQNDLLLDFKKEGKQSYEIHMTAHCVLNSFASLCMAYVFFHPDVWAAADDVNCLRSMLLSDMIPVVNEDELLLRVMELGQNADHLDGLLKLVRWQYLSPAVLFDACMKENSPLRKCQTTKLALHWLLGSGDIPGCACERRRSFYDKVVRDNRSVMRDAVVNWLMGDRSLPRARSELVAT
eukprot:TRINITY_DN33266_c0_g1_i1.p1 TRINITY_DN33266_c0_g1~~TRINITY_DN33266_c0_g1_i1.p1  ORF type:complete len:549 (-),score=40.03 TRINITY_DN33266_c0_g1_i1:98-1744(-)